MTKQKMYDFETIFEVDYDFNLCKQKKEFIDILETSAPQRVNKFDSVDTKWDLNDIDNYYWFGKYNKLHNCKNGLILATDSDGNNGYINKKGQIIIPFGKYHSHSDFSCGLAQVWDDEYGNIYIDKTGKILEIEV